jgi:hypothetical protein
VFGAAVWEGSSCSGECELGPGGHWLLGGRWLRVHGDGHRWPAGGSLVCGLGMLGLLWLLLSASLQGGPECGMLTEGLGRGTMFGTFCQ